MFKIEQDHIYLTRGDTAEFRPIISNYESAEGDKVIFAMKKSWNKNEPALRIEVNCGDNISFGANTSNLTPGTYLYDLKIKTAKGTVYTFVNGARFDLLEEIDDE